MEIIISNIPTMIFMLIIMILLILVLFRKKGVSWENPENSFELLSLANRVKEIVNENINLDVSSLNLNETEIKKREEQKKALKHAVRNCSCGGSEKEYVKEYIKSLLEQKLGVCEETIDCSMPFDCPNTLSAREKFDILMWVYTKIYHKTAFIRLAENYHWLTPKEDSEGYHYVVTAEEISEAYALEHPRLRYVDKLELLTYRIYTYFGHGAVDMLRDNTIDGLAGGQGGIVFENYDYRKEQGKEEIEEKRYAHDSIWVQVKGIWIHLDFLSFESAQELERVTRALIQYDAPYELTKSRPKIVTDMKDGSRVTAMRPPLSETWTFFLRKFESCPQGIENSYSGKGVDQLASYLKYLVKGGAHIAITGLMGSGKTTLLKELIRYINPTYNIRTSETMFELNIRKILPNRNIVPFRETDSVSMEELVDSLKKTDASCILLGEVSSEQLASLSTQLAKITIQQLFTCHPTSTEALVSYFQQALMNHGSFSDERLAQEEVVRSIHLDIHTCKDEQTGQRYIEYINEIVPLQFENSEGRCERQTNCEHQTTRTNQHGYSVRTLLRFQDGGYKLLAAPTKELLNRMLARMRHSDGAEFMTFLEQINSRKGAA